MLDIASGSVATRSAATYGYKTSVAYPIVSERSPPEDADYRSKSAGGGGGNS